MRLSFSELAPAERAQCAPMLVWQARRRWGPRPARTDPACARVGLPIKVLVLDGRERLLRSCETLLPSSRSARHFVAVHDGGSQGPLFRRRPCRARVPGPCA